MSHLKIIDKHILIEHTDNNRIRKELNFIMACLLITTRCVYFELSVGYIPAPFIKPTECLSLMFIWISVVHTIDKCHHNNIVNHNKNPPNSSIDWNQNIGTTLIFTHGRCPLDTTHRSCKNVAWQKIANGQQQKKRNVKRRIWRNHAIANTR